MVGINRYSNIPLYCQLKNIIIEKIESGEYKEDTKIPSEQELCEQYNISRPTVRQAINELTNNGYLYKLKGKGTFVSKLKSCIIDIKNYTGFTDSILDSPEPENKEILSVTVVTPRDMPKLNEIFSPKNESSQFTCITYLNTNNGEVYSLTASYIPQSLFPDIGEDIMSKKPSYEILRGKYPLIPYTSKSMLEVEFANPADAPQMMVQPGQALIVVYNVLYSKSGQAVEYVVSKYRADKCRLMFENRK